MPRPIALVPANLERPRNDELARVARLRTWRRRKLEAGLPRFPRLQTRRDCGFVDRILIQDLATDIDPALCVRRRAGGVVLLFRSISLVQPHSDNLEICLLSRDFLTRYQPDPTRYRLTDPRRPVERQLAVDGAVAPMEEVLGPEKPERVAALFPNESRPIQRIERRRNRSRVISIGPEVQVERHRSSLMVRTGATDTASSMLLCGRSRPDSGDVAVQEFHHRRASSALVAALRVIDLLACRSIYVGMRRRSTMPILIIRHCCEAPDDGGGW